jgi:chromosome partitioning protein
VHVLSVSSLKGGVGKTTVALGLASAAYARGLRTLVVDLDPQCDASTGLGAFGGSTKSVADVLSSPRHAVVHDSIVASSWGKVQSGHIDVMLGSPKTLNFDHPNPTLRDLWRLEEALSIDTPPSINGLTRTGWVASDRILIVSEPSIFSVVAADRALKAINELRKGLTPRLRALGVIINRVRPGSQEHDFRIGELKNLFQGEFLTAMLEEKATVQQAQGAGRPIHTWPGESAAQVAQVFDQILDAAYESFALVDESRNSKKERRFGRFSRILRGKQIDKDLETGPANG